MDKTTQEFVEQLCSRAVEGIHQQVRNVRVLTAIGDVERAEWARPAHNILAQLETALTALNSLRLAPQEATVETPRNRLARAMAERRRVSITKVDGGGRKDRVYTPWRFSGGDGRESLFAYNETMGHPEMLRLDNILAITVLDEYFSPSYEGYRIMGARDEGEE